MATINVTINEPLSDGMEIKFRTPCDCTAVTGVKVSYCNEDGSTGMKTFTFYDTHAKSIANLGNLFASGVLVKVMLDTSTSRAFILNAATNSYLENKIGSSGGTSNTFFVYGTRSSDTNTFSTISALFGEIKTHVVAGDNVVLVVNDVNYVPLTELFSTVAYFTQTTVNGHIVRYSISSTEAKVQSWFECEGNFKSSVWEG